MLSAHCISLVRRPDRRHAVQEQFAAIDLPVHFVDAVDGQSPDVRSSLPPSLSISSSEFGCAQSHRRCWQLLLDTTAPWVLVVEDDVRVEPSFLPAVQAALTCPEPWDLIHVGYNCQPKLTHHQPPAPTPAPVSSRARHR